MLPRAAEPRFPATGLERSPRLPKASWLFQVRVSLWGCNGKKKNLSSATSLPQSKQKTQTRLTEKLTPPRASERSHVFPLTSPSSEGGFKEPAACAERSPAGCTPRAALNKAGGAGVWAKILLHSNDIDVLVPAKTSVLLLPGCSHLKFIQMLVNEQ